MNLRFVLVILCSFVTFGDCCKFLFDLLNSILAPATTTPTTCPFLNLTDETDLIFQIVEATHSSKDHDPSGPLPIDEKVLFYLYTQKNPATPVIFDIDGDMTEFTNHFDHLKPTFFVAHGFLAHGKDEMCNRIRDAYLNFDVNVIVVDWGTVTRLRPEDHGLNNPFLVMEKIAGLNMIWHLLSYEYTVNQMDTVADKVTSVIKNLETTKKMNLDTLTLVGHSLGAQLFGRVGQRLSGQIAVIVGLDPAYPHFRAAEKDDLKLTPDDAKYIQVIHTNAGRLGHWEPIGTADFYIEGGFHQPGCPCEPKGLNECSHGRAWEVFGESIHSKNGFFGRECTTKFEARAFRSDEPHTCGGSKIVKMGGLKIDTSVKGIYSIQTNEKSPFAKDLKI